MNLEDFKLKFPGYFDNCYCGVELPEGWTDLVVKLCQDLKALGEEIEVHQIKEKFGCLRFYTGGASDPALDLISEAERKSYEICETCGKPGSPTETGWIRTLCNTHKSPFRGIVKRATEDDS